MPGPDVTVEAAAALADLPSAEAARLLDRLAAAHLVGRPGAGRYAFHGLLRCYATQRAEAEDPAAERLAALGRLFDRYMHRANAAARVLGPEKR